MHRNAQLQSAQIYTIMAHASSAVKTTKSTTESPSLAWANRVVSQGKQALWDAIVAKKISIVVSRGIATFGCEEIATSIPDGPALIHETAVLAAYQELASMPYDIVKGASECTATAEDRTLLELADGGFKAWAEIKNQRGKVEMTIAHFMPSETAAEAGLPDDRPAIVICLSSED
jgi:hypothetical protein